MAESDRKEVPLDIWHRIQAVLETARENASEIYEQHMRALGDSTRKNKAVADMLCGDYEEVCALLEYMRKERADSNRWFDEETKRRRHVYSRE